jgi:beta-glucanase (GH16 family)
MQIIRFMIKNFSLQPVIIIPFLLISNGCVTNFQKPNETINNLYSEWHLVWNDEFDQPDGSQPNPQNWSYEKGGGGWGNGEAQKYTDTLENSYIEDGKLVIKANISTTEGLLPEYTSARLVTRGKHKWLYGRFEFRAKLPYGQGIWPAFWLLPQDMKYGSWPLSGEIDIMEMVGHEPGTIYGTIHYGKPHQFQGISYELPLGERFANNFHTFALEWEPKEIRWYVDGNLYQTLTQWFTSITQGERASPFDQPFYIIIILAVGGQWPGWPDKTTEFPQYLVIDYIRVYQKEP